MNSASSPPMKSYRTPRRRPAYLRTKTGCVPCRTRKKKCDETHKPSACQSCARRGTLCFWIETSSNPAQALWPLSPSATSSASEQDVPEDLQLVQALPRPRQDSNSPADLTSPRIDNVGASPLSDRSTVLSSSAACDSDSLLFDYMRHTFLPSLIRPMADKQHIIDFEASSLQLAYNKPFCMDALLACAAAEWQPADNSVARRLAQKHYARALAGLREHLTMELKQHLDLTLLRTVILLCIYERSGMATSAAAGTHLAAAATILNGSCKRLLLKTNEQQRRDENLVLSLEAVIFHAAAAAPFQETAEHPAIVDDAFATAQAVLEQLRDRGEYSVELSPILGAPPKLFHFVRQFSLLRRKCETTGFDDIDQMQDLGRQFELWRLDEYNSSPTRDDAGHDEIQETVGPDLYVFVLRLLFSCMETIRPPSNGDRETLLRKTMSLTDRIDPVTGYFADYYCWPFYWLGTCLHGRDDAQRLLLKKVSAFYDVTRIDAMRKLGFVLQDIWAG